MHIVSKETIVEIGSVEPALGQPPANDSKEIEC